MVRYDKDGNFLKEEVFQGKDATWFYGLQHLNDEAYVYVGTSYVSGTYYQDNIYIVYNTDYYIYDIFSKVEGKGTITVSQNKASANTEITFEVTPEKGYKIDKILVTDADGKVITFTNNKFTMPSADVTIEVIFIEDKKNPETTDVAVIACIAIIVLGGIGTMYSIRKLSWLK